MPDPQLLTKLFKYMDEHQEQYKAALKKAVAIPSVSADVKYRPDCVRMAEWTAAELKKLGGTVQLRGVGIQEGIPEENVKLPPVVIGTLGNDKAKKTICIYGHLDVWPATKSNGWDTEPFELVEKNDKLYGRGSTSDQGTDPPITKVLF